MAQIWENTSLRACQICYNAGVGKDHSNERTERLRQADAQGGSGVCASQHRGPRQNQEHDPRGNE